MKKALTLVLIALLIFTLSPAGAYAVPLDEFYGLVEAYLLTVTGPTYRYVSWGRPWVRRWCGILLPGLQH
jgi:hypothetical protein